MDTIIYTIEKNEKTVFATFDIDEAQNIIREISGDTLHIFDNSTPIELSNYMYKVSFYSNSIDVEKLSNEIYLREYKLNPENDNDHYYCDEPDGYNIIVHTNCSEFYTDEYSESVNINISCGFNENPQSIALELYEEEFGEYSFEGNE